MTMLGELSDRPRSRWGSRLVWRMVAVVGVLAGLWLAINLAMPGPMRSLWAWVRADTDQPPPSAVTLRFPTANATVVAELARTPEERQRGLQGRTVLPDGRGMLFIFPAATGGAFWMKDTPLPLSIAFLDDAGLIIDIQDMQPFDETLHYAPRPYRYALEVPQGWFRRAGVVSGQRVELPPGL